MKAWFISDIHLKGLNERNGNVLLRFLISLRDQKNPATHLFLLGDIFDFWVGDHEYYFSKFLPIIEVLLDLKNHGIKVIYVEGNHDVHVKDFWSRHGIEAFVEDRYFDLGPWKIRVSHGDLINPQDTKYVKYRNFIRHEIMEKVAQWLPAKQLNVLGDWASQLSRKKSSVRRRDSELELKNLIHEYAKKSYEEKPYNFFISGHMHFRDEWSFRVGEHQPVSINLGSWFEKPTALCLDSSGYSWLEL